MRVFYDLPFTDVTPAVLADLYGYPGSTFARGEIERWLESARPYAEQTDIDILDLFYWEQRIANWGARAPYERDIATHAFTPFNNYNLLLAGLSIPRRERTAPDYSFFEDILREMRPELLSFPINPEPSGGIVRTGKDWLKRMAKEYRTLYELERAYRLVQ